MRKLLTLFLSVMLITSIFTVTLLTVAATDADYTANTDFFDEESDAEIAYRAKGISIKNYSNDNIEFASAVASGNYDFGDYVEIEYKYDGLQIYNPSMPLSILKGTYFRFYDATSEDKEILIFPFLFKDGDNYILYLNLIINGMYTYTNYRIGDNFTDYQNKSFFLSYNPLQETVEVGSASNKTVINLGLSNNDGTESSFDASNIPNANLIFDVRVQFGGILIERINEYSFINNQNLSHLFVDPVITDFDILETTMDANITISPQINYNDFTETQLKLYYTYGAEDFTEIISDNGTYDVTFNDFGNYKFLYELIFDGVAHRIIKIVNYQNSLIQDIEGLFTAQAGTYIPSQNGLVFTNNNTASNEFVHAKSVFSVAGNIEIIFSLEQLQDSFSIANFKEIWIDFSDGNDGLWIKIICFNAPEHNVNDYVAFASILTYNQDKSSQVAVQENVPLNFIFNSVIDVSSNNVKIVYKPYQKSVSIGKEGTALTEFDLSNKDLPQGMFNLGVSVNYGGMILKQLNGFSFEEREDFEYPAPFIIAEAVSDYYIAGDKIYISKNYSLYDLFDLRPIFSVTLKNESQNNIVLDEESINGKIFYTAALSQAGEYRITYFGENIMGKTSELEKTIFVINEDLLPPVINFAIDAFSHLKEGDRANRYEVAKDTEVTLPIPELSDDSGVNPTLTITVLNPLLNPIPLTNNRFTVSDLGTYRVEYKATDITGKTTIHNVVIISRLNLPSDNDDGDEGGKNGCGSCGGSISENVTIILAFLFLLCIFLNIKRYKNNIKRV